MSVLNNGIRSWWLEKPLSHNMPTDVVFEQYKPTTHNGRDREWIRVISLDDLHSKINMNITRWVDVCNQLSGCNSENKKLQKENEELKKENGELRKIVSWCRYQLLPYSDYKPDYEKFHEMTKELFKGEAK